MALTDQRFEICAEAGDVTQAIAEAQRAQPDICLVGSDLPGGGMDAVRGIQTVAPDATVIVLAGAGNASELLMAVRAGAVGYVPSTTTREQLCRACQAALAGEAVVPRSMVRALIGELHRSAALIAGDITSRQGQVLDLLRHGDTPAEIARHLEISPVTVRRHISDLLRKFGLEDRRALASLDLGIANAGVRHGSRPGGNGARHGSRPHDNGQPKPRRQ